MDPNAQTQQTQNGQNGLGQAYPPNGAPNSVPTAQIQPAGMPRPDAVIPDAYGTAPTQAAPQAQPFVPPAYEQPLEQQTATPSAYAAPQAYTPPVAPAISGTPTKPVSTGSNPNSTQNTLQIAEIRDGIVIMNDGSYRSVVMVKSINFDLMSPQEQEAVEYAYQGFLNSLYFPVQIFVRSQKVDLQPYIEKLDKIRTEHDNMLLALLMDDYIGYIDQLAQQTNIMDKKFYIVIPFFPTIDVQKALTQSKNFFTGLGQLFSKAENHVVVNEGDLEKAKTELRNRVQSVLAGLQQCNIQGLPLDTQELIELYYDSYNPDTATRQQLKNFDQLTADVITKGQGMAQQAHLQRELQ